MASASASAGLSSTVFVARQPIFDRSKNVFAYELLFRSSEKNVYDATDADSATLDVIANSFLVIGLEELTGRRRGFINFTRNLLLQEVAEVLPSELVTVEILETITPDNEVLAACRRLRNAGYMLALDDFVLADGASPFLEVADIVKVDFAGTTPDERTRIVQDLRRRKIKPLAEKVETPEHFAEAMEAGYAYFQGYFFSKPEIRTGSRLTANRLIMLRMLHEINRPTLSYDQLEAIIKQDVSLTFKLLQLINSAGFGLKRQVASIKQALLLFGPKEIRKWFSLIMLRSIGADKPTELVLQSMTRARMCESIATLLQMQQQASELFLLGLLSAIDALLDTPMTEILAKLPLEAQVKSALLGQPGPFRAVLELILAYEQAAWPEFARHVEQLQLDEAAASAIICDSLKWANQACALA